MIRAFVMRAFILLAVLFFPGIAIAQSPAGTINRKDTPANCVSGIAMNSSGVMSCSAILNTASSWSAIQTFQSVTKYTGAVKTTPLTGATITFAATQPLAIIVPAGTIATLTVTLPACAAGNDGDERAFLTSQAVTTLTVNTSGGTIAGSAATGTTAGSGRGYHCFGAGPVWYQMY